MKDFLRVFIITFWVFDITNMPFMEIFDTTYPINGWAWFLILLLVPSVVDGDSFNDF